MIATTFGTGQVVYSILWFFLFFVEIWLMVSIFIDIFRSHDLSGWAKAAWVLLVLIFPIVGILAYLIVRGDKMRAHQLKDAVEERRLLGERRSVTEELSQLAELRREGVIDEQEFQQLKADILRRSGDGGGQVA